MKLLNKKGFSLMETIVTIGVLGIISYAVFNGLSSTLKEVKVTNQEKSTNDIYIELLNTITTQAKYTQANYTTESAVSILSKSLPMAWSTEGDRTPITQCLKSCPPGRYGFVIKPITGSRGLFKLTLKISHPSWEKDKIYEMLVGE